jgi:hypothetical protein
VKSKNLVSVFLVRQALTFLKPFFAGVTVGVAVEVEVPLAVLSEGLRLGKLVEASPISLLRAAALAIFGGAADAIELVGLFPTVVFDGSALEETERAITGIPRAQNSRT